MELTICPECGTVAEVLWRTELDSTSGPVEHAKVLCLHRHGFFLPVESLTTHDTATDLPTYATPQSSPAPVEVAPLANGGSDHRSE